MEPPLLLLRTLISLGLFSFVTTQVCDEGSYTLINNPRRSVQVLLDSGVDTPICDIGIAEGTWFRFLSYTGDAVVERAANDPVPELHCGTEAPIYIRGLGSHPVTDNTTTNATVCANYGGDPCQWMDTIQIHRCPGYYLYKLKSPLGCPISYCVGDKEVCNLGYYWNGFSCINYFPPMKAFPIFSGPHINGSGYGKEIYFTCEVQYDRQPNDSNARFRVTFLFDGLPLEDVDVYTHIRPERLEPTILYPDSSLVAVLNETYLRGRLGREISCQAESSWDGDSNANSSLRSVAKYYAAFESTAESYNISLTNGSTFNVTFKSTLPLTCRHCANKAPNAASTCCRYSFRMLDYNASSVQCILLWTGGDTASVTVYFVPGVTQEKKSFALVFEKYKDDEVSALGRSIWRDYMIPPVLMTILPQSTPYKECKSVTDPHVTTFDRPNDYFNNLMVGDFYLVKSTNAKQPMEIQVRHEICNGITVTCNCGVIVREGNSAFKISICETGSWGYTQRSPTVVRLLSQDPPDSSTVYIDGTGLLYSVRMPSGLRVEVDLRAPWFNVQVFLPPEYHGKTDSDSMCGNSNGNRNDDYTTNVERFRIPDNLSYFRHQPNCSSIFNVNATRCGCNTTYPICSNKDPNLQFMSKPNNPFPGNWTSGVVCRPNQTTVALMSSLLYDNSNADNDFILGNDILFPPYTYDPNVGVNVSFTWPTPKNKTEAQVKQHCADMLQSSPAYADCSANVDVASLIDMCASDIQIADDWISINAYANVFQQGCLNNIAATINSSDSSSSNSTLDSLTSVSRKLCPNQCSGNGTCSEGACICNTGFIGTDCSIDQTLPPSLTGVIRRGACDVRTRPCDVISVYGSGVAFSSALKCRFTDQNTGAHVETMGTFITAGEYSCPVPATTTHRRRRSVTTRTTALSTKNVSITVNGALYSNTLDFVLFDSVCMECNSSDTCRQTNNSCLLTGECFAAKAINPDDSCLQCVPSVSRNSWTDVTVVQNWTLCTRQCDYGARSKDTLCRGTTERTEVELCRLADCPENKDEEHEGVGFTFSEEDLKKILKGPEEFFNPITEALNSYCSRNAVKCCQSVGVSSTSVTSVAYTSTNLTTYASGYPMVTTSDTQVKIIVKIDENRIRADCSETAPLSSSIVYAQPKILYDAISSAKTDIERELGVTIESVWSPESVTPEPMTTQHATPEHTTPEPSTPERVTPQPATIDPTTPEHTTPKSVTPEHATPEHTTPEHTTPEPVMTQTITPKPVTPKPVTPKPVTPEPVPPKPKPSKGSTASTTCSSLFLIIGTYFLLK